LEKRFINVSKLTFIQRNIYVNLTFTHAAV